MGQSADLYVTKGRPPTIHKNIQNQGPKCLTVLIWKENQSSRCDLLGGGGGANTTAEGPSSLGGGAGAGSPRRFWTIGSLWLLSLRRASISSNFSLLKPKINNFDALLSHNEHIEPKSRVKSVSADQIKRAPLLERPRTPPGPSPCYCTDLEQFPLFRFSIIVARWPKTVIVVSFIRTSTVRESPRCP